MLKFQLALIFPLRVEEQAAIIYCGTNGLLMDVPVFKNKGAEKEYFLHTKHQDVLDQLASGKLDDKITSCLEKAVNELAPKYKENA